VTCRRILYVVNSFDPGGAEHGLLALLQNEFFAGHELKILAFCRGRGALSRRITAVAGAANVVLVSDQPTLTVRALLAGARALWREHRNWQPEVVVLSLKQANVVGRLIACFFPASRCVSFEHIARYRARRLEWIYRYVLWALSFRVDEIWADSHETHRETRRYFVPRRRKQHVLPVFYTNERMPYKTSYARHTPLRLVAAGRLVDRKNMILAIQAVRVLRARGDAVSLEIFGDGPELDALRNAAREWGVADHVHLAGYTQDWAHHAIEHDVFVNLSDTEGFCIVVAEAMAAGMPVVATDVGGIREYGRDGQNMLKLESPDVTQLVAQIDRLASRESLRRRLGEAARRDMLEDYSDAAMRRRSRIMLGSPPPDLTATRDAVASEGSRDAHS
jgi:glycosyltransferase involved in cell wall biosynthesis